VVQSEPLNRAITPQTFLEVGRTMIGNLGGPTSVRSALEKPMTPRALFFVAAALITLDAIGYLTQSGGGGHLHAIWHRRHDCGCGAVTLFPLAPPPTFLVPLAFILLVISLWQLLGGTAVRQPAVTSPGGQ
jgi:hypothetical protein